MSWVGDIWKKHLTGVRSLFHSLLPFLGLGAVIATLLYTGIDKRLFKELAADKAALLGGVLAFAALLVSVLLGLIVLLVSLEQRPIVKELRADEAMYRKLVGYAFEGIVVFLILGGVAICGFFIAPSDPELLKRGLAIAVCAVATMGLLETFRFSWYLVHLMSEPPRTVRKSNTPEEARKRATEEPPATPNMSSDRSAHLVSP